MLRESVAGDRREIHLQVLEKLTPPLLGVPQLPYKRALSSGCRLECSPS